MKKQYLILLFLSLSLFAQKKEYILDENNTTISQNEFAVRMKAPSKYVYATIENDTSIITHLAIKKAEGGDAGPLYFFYLQTGEGEFEIDDFLTDSMAYFPFVIDAKAKHLITLVYANDYQMNETVFELKGKKNWKEVSNRLVP